MIGSILIVEDDALQRQMLATLLRRKMEYDALEAAHGREALDILARTGSSAIKLIILDLEMPVMGGMETLEILRQKYPALPVILLTGNAGVEKAVQAIKLGAVDFISKPYEGDRLIVTVKNALKLSLLSKEVLRLKRERTTGMIFDDLIGAEGGLLPAVLTGKKAAAADIPVLLGGETGTGKEVFARAIHAHSARASGPFIAVNCGAIPQQLVESTLFGHEKGAFTGATEKTAGKFREAEGGTIFLDEVGELPRDTQVKLLRVLQQREVEPVGGARPVPVNVRVISATNRDLEQDVKAGSFREDLYFRLNVLPLILPPLRDRARDIPDLVLYFIERFCAQNNLPLKTISKAALELLGRQPWPGNVRELENAINRAIVLSSGTVLEEADFSAALHEASTHDTAVTSPFMEQPVRAIDLRTARGVFKTMNDIEQEAMALALEHHNGNITKAAEMLGIAKSTFYRKIQSETKVETRDPLS